MNAARTTLRLALALTALLAASPLTQPRAEQGPRPSLRASIVVESGLVTLGDLFENAGRAAKTPVFRAPDPGETGHVSVARVAEAASRHGLEWRNENAIARVAVRRDSTPVSLDKISETITQALREKLSLNADERIQVTLARKSRPLHLPAALDGAIRVAHLDLEPGSGEFSAELIPTGEAATGIRATYRGTAVLTVQVPVLTASVARGGAIAASQIEMQDMPRSRIPSDALMRAEDIAGMAARRALQPGQALRADDVAPQILVRRNAPVTIVYSHGALTISMLGRSLDDGTRGDVVRILNLRSKRTIEATVSGPDRATVMPNTLALSALLDKRAAAQQ